MLPLFSNLWYLDGTFITDEYEHFPSKIDNDNCKKMKFVNVYNPMQPHKDEMWWKIMHLTQVNYFDYFGELPLEFDSQVELNKFFEVSKFDKYIAFAPFAGSYAWGNDKMLTVDNANKIVNMLIKMGYKVLQIGGQN